MNHKNQGISRRAFLKSSVLTASGIATAATLNSCSSRTSKGPVIDVHMHLENVGNYWEGLIDEIIEQYDYAGIDKGVIFNMWMPSRESNDRTLIGYKKYPDRFIPFGHVRPIDSDWEDEIKRMSDFGWKGIKLHHGELNKADPDLRKTTMNITEKLAKYKIRIDLIHLNNYDLIDEITREFPEIIFIIPHMGSQRGRKDLKLMCELAKNRKNMYLDTCNVGGYHLFGEAFQWAGIDKIIFGTDGFQCSPLVEKDKVETLKLPTPYRTPRLTDEQLDMILGGNVAKLLEL